MATRSNIQIELLRVRNYIFNPLSPPPVAQHNEFSSCNGCNRCNRCKDCKRRNRLYISICLVSLAGGWVNEIYQYIYI